MLSGAVIWCPQYLNNKIWVLCFYFYFTKSFPFHSCCSKVRWQHYHLCIYVSLHRCFGHKCNFCTAHNRPLLNSIPATHTHMRAHKQRTLQSRNLGNLNPIKRKNIKQYPVHLLSRVFSCSVVQWENYRFIAFHLVGIVGNPFGKTRFFPPPLLTNETSKASGSLQRT